MNTLENTKGSVCVVDEHGDAQDGLYFHYSKLSV